MPTRWRYLCLAALSPLAAVAADTPLVLHDAWVRALPPTGTTTAAYLTVENTGDAAQSVAGFRADGAASVELHRTVTVDGMVRIVVRPTWAKLIDFETTLPTNVQELLEQRAAREAAG